MLYCEHSSQTEFISREKWTTEISFCYDASESGASDVVGAGQLYVHGKVLSKSVEMHDF